MLVLPFLLYHGLLIHATATNHHPPLDRSETESILSLQILDAKSLLVSLGVSEENLCRKSVNSSNSDSIDDSNLWLLPFCDDQSRYQLVGGNYDHFARRLDEEVIAGEACGDEEISFADDPLHFMINALCACLCVTTAALAAGLTMGLLSIDPLMMLVKIRAAHSQDEKDQAEAILPIIKKHHLLLVTLLLLNSLANEALPIFLETLVSPIVSVLLSVSFLLM